MALIDRDSSLGRAGSSQDDVSLECFIESHGSFSFLDLLLLGDNLGRTFVCFIGGDDGAALECGPTSFFVCFESMARHIEKVWMSSELPDIDCPG